MVGGFDLTLIAVVVVSLTLFIAVILGRKIDVTVGNKIHAKLQPMETLTNDIKEHITSELERQLQPIHAELQYNGGKKIKEMVKELHQRLDAGEVKRGKRAGKAS